MDQRFNQLLKSQEISLSELARCTQITPGYLSKIFNGKTSNVSLGIVARISEQLGLPADDLFRMIKEENFLPKALSNTTNTGTLPQSFEEAVQSALDALESNDNEGFYFLSERIKSIPSHLQKNYVNWFEGLQLAYENLYDPALERFQSAQRFKARSTIERRFKAKISSGIASLYLGQGNYKKALAMFRKSLMAWEEGVHSGAVYLNMGTLNRRNGAYKSAELCYRSALLTPVPYIQLLSYAALGQLYIDQKRLPEARAVLLQGYCLAKNSPSDRGKGELFCNLGKYYKEIGRLEKATELLKRGLIYTTTPISKRARQYLLLELIDAYFTSKGSEAEPLIKTLLEEDFAEGDVLLEGISLITIAKEKMKTNHVAEAITLLQQCYRILSQVSPSEELISCCSLLAKCFQFQKEPFHSEFYLKEGKRLRRIFGMREKGIPVGLDSLTSIGL
ncbi:MAG: hypothetical protein H6Q63_193 [Firmicutes bacterium]|nr:hypothetical protein [Bacillota bacterium]